MEIYICQSTFASAPFLSIHQQKIVPNVSIFFWLQVFFTLLNRLPSPPFRSHHGVIKCAKLELVCLDNALPNPPPPISNVILCLELMSCQFVTYPSSQYYNPLIGSKASLFDTVAFGLYCTRRMYFSVKQTNTETKIATYREIERQTETERERKVHFMGLIRTNWETIDWVVS